ncbi:hypothetical protein FB451DRAFT_1199098 [Mycena latifolia]|nr:hypothetical protein FB451DRAFT_1199098 [Mycena latifolia]
MRDNLLSDTGAPPARPRSRHAATYNSKANSSSTSTLYPPRITISLKPTSSAAATAAPLGGRASAPPKRRVSARGDDAPCFEDLRDPLDRPEPVARHHQGEGDASGGGNGGASAHRSVPRMARTRPVHLGLVPLAEALDAAVLVPSHMDQRRVRPSAPHGKKDDLPLRESTFLAGRDCEEESLPARVRMLLATNDAWAWVERQLARDAIRVLLGRGGRASGALGSGGLGRGGRAGGEVLVLCGGGSEGEVVRGGRKLVCGGGKVGARRGTGDGRGGCGAGRILTPRQLGSAANSQSGMIPQHVSAAFPAATCSRIVPPAGLATTAASPPSCTPRSSSVTRVTLGPRLSLPRAGISLPPALAPGTGARVCEVLVTSTQRLDQAPSGMKCQLRTSERDGTRFPPATPRNWASSALRATSPSFLYLDFSPTSPAGRIISPSTAFLSPCRLVRTPHKSHLISLAPSCPRLILRSTNQSRTGACPLPAPQPSPDSLLLVSTADVHAPLPPPPKNIDDSLLLRYFIIYAESDLHHGPGWECYWTTPLFEPPLHPFVNIRDPSSPEWRFWLSDNAYHAYLQRLERADQRKRALAIFAYALDNHNDDYSTSENPPPLLPLDSSYHRPPRTLPAPARPKKKTTHQFSFQGQRAEFLSSRLNTFFASLDKSRLRQFWPVLFDEYWKLFPWRLPVDEEPHCAMLIDGVNCELRVNEWEWRHQIITRTETKLDVGVVERSHPRRIDPCEGSLHLNVRGIALEEQAHAASLQIGEAPGARLLSESCAVPARNKVGTHASISAAAEARVGTVERVSTEAQALPTGEILWIVEAAVEFSAVVCRVALIAQKQFTVEGGQFDVSPGRRVRTCNENFPQLSCACARAPDAPSGEARANAPKLPTEDVALEEKIYPVVPSGCMLNVNWYEWKSMVFAVLSGAFYVGDVRLDPGTSANKAPAREEECPPVYDSSAIFTFVPHRAAPLVSFQQHDGSLIPAHLLPHVPADAPCACGAIFHAPSSIGVNTHRCRAAEIEKRARAILDARPDADTLLLARLAKSSGRTDPSPPQKSADARARFHEGPADQIRGQSAHAVDRQRGLLLTRADVGAPAIPTPNHAGGGSSRSHKPAAPVHRGVISESAMIDFEHDFEQDPQQCRGGPQIVAVAAAYDEVAVLSRLGRVAVHRGRPGDNVDEGERRTSHQGAQDGVLRRHFQNLRGGGGASQSGLAPHRRRSAKDEFVVIPGDTSLCLGTKKWRRNKDHLQHSTRRPRSCSASFDRASARHDGSASPGNTIISPALKRPNFERKDLLPRSPAAVIVEKMEDT